MKYVFLDKSRIPERASPRAGPGMKSVFASLPVFAGQSPERRALEAIVIRADARRFLKRMNGMKTDVRVNPAV